MSGQGRRGAKAAANRRKLRQARPKGGSAKSKAAAKAGQAKAAGSGQESRPQGGQKGPPEGCGKRKADDS